MSVSKFLHLGTALSLHNRLPLSPLPRLLPKALQFHPRYCSTASSAAVAAADSTESLCSPDPHPWPEWVTFVDRLKSKGYFTESSSPTDSVYKDMGVVRDACLSFARDRYDIIVYRRYSKVVECGCPNLYRKAVNSGKRLRAYVRLDEGDVCSTCSLRGSCDRAYVILKETEADARTVDIVRILLFYALDSLVLSGGEKPPGRQAIESSARKLLSELIELSETSPDPALPKPAVKALKQKDDSLDFMDDVPSQDVEMKRGIGCVLRINSAENAMKMALKELVWVMNIRCLKCKAEGPKRVSAAEVEMKKGDWNCEQCGFMNFASNRNCLRCRVARPKRQLNPGEWECPSCDFLNYRKNMVCLKCNCERPKEAAAASEYEEQLWKRPH
ncbi:zinc finger protein var3 [Quercus suber]|uniref:Zinc finger protein var3 n=1 Tax=Quercus suber TaxID=58331 RepID=A0AAW0M2P0_QUESU